MRLVRFTAPNGMDVWVNPAGVCIVDDAAATAQYPGCSSILKTQAGTIGIVESPSLVVSLLTSRDSE